MIDAAAGAVFQALKKGAHGLRRLTLARQHDLVSR